MSDQYTDDTQPDAAQAQAQYIADAERLVDQYPDLAEQNNAERLVAMSSHVAEAIGQPDLATDPTFMGAVRATLDADRATPHDMRELADQIVNPTPGKGSDVLPFG